jgi:DNA adenine methylase
VELFCGSAKLLFAKTPSQHEVINDINGELMNFFLVAKYRPSALAEKFYTALVHPLEFKRLRAMPVSRDEVERAFQFLYLTRFSFGSKGEHFAFPSTDFSKNKRLLFIEKSLQKTAERLSNVAIESQDFAAVIAKYDSPSTLFYCDPPYVNFGGNGRYGVFTGAQLDTLLRALSRIKGKFLMSEESHPEVATRLRGGRFRVRRMKTSYTLQSVSNNKTVTELLISNF